MAYPAGAIRRSSDPDRVSVTSLLLLALGLSVQQVPPSNSAVAARFSSLWIAVLTSSNGETDLRLYGSPERRMQQDNTEDQTGPWREQVLSIRQLLT